MNIIDEFFTQNAIPKIESLSPEDKTKLAKHLGVSLRAINHYIKGKRFPKKDNLSKILEFLGLSLIGKTDQSQFIKGLENKTEGLAEKNKMLEDKIKLLEENKGFLEADNNRLKKILASFNEKLKASRPPEGVKERRLCRMEFNNFFKGFDLEHL